MLYYVKFNFNFYVFKFWMNVSQGSQRIWNFWKPKKVREFCDTWKKSRNFVKFKKVREFYLREMNIAEVLHKSKLMWMSIIIFKSCTRTPKSEKIFWKGQGKVREFWKVEMLATLNTMFNRRLKHYPLSGDIIPSLGC